MKRQRNGYVVVMVSNRVDALLKDVLSLTPSERAELAEHLLDSLDESAEASEQDSDEAWLQEIERRAERAHAGEATGEDWRVVMQRLEDRLRSK